MPTTVPAMKARLGDINYYIVSMKVGELAEKAKILSEQPEWENSTIEELYQRKINYSRVENQIAPYLAGTKSRFFGSVIVAVRKFKDDQFESLEELSNSGLVQRPSRAYRDATRGVGIITFDGGEVLEPLDGQHRIKALKCAISGTGNNGQDLGFMPDPDLADEDVCVILVPHQLKQSRRIFTTVNKYAKNTTTNENIIVNDDDVIARITRMIANEIFGARLINMDSNTLGITSGYFTTLSTIYTSTEAMLCSRFKRKFSTMDKKALPEKGKVTAYENAARNLWGKLVKDIDQWSAALKDKSPKGDSNRSEMRKASLLGRPIVQQVLIESYIRLRNAQMSHNQACTRLNKVDFGVYTRPEDRPEWHGVCITPAGKMTNKLVPLAIRIIAYIAGENLTRGNKDQLLSDYKKNDPARNKSHIQLPPQVKA